MEHRLHCARDGRPIFGAINLWCSLNRISVKINRLGARRHVPYVQAAVANWELTCTWYAASKSCCKRKDLRTHLQCMPGFLL